MTAKMQELLGLLTLVVERVRAANDRSERAEARAGQMSLLLDALSDENAALRTELDQAEAAAAEAQAEIRALRDEVEPLEARADEAELRIHRAADALGLAVAGPTVAGDEAPSASLALH
ncbi:hypothetical protein [Methylobacterium gnaphalii]|uniref:Uncharacterized protein n=1 Tax=Methylobacterium gnaphalii TaxID=1010610 RepID=A0A512JG90_9HYPH|nr:hypothetical protein [Methylobacterium gnaphalii]GEP08971.1 hypothetical protein MGN01_08160 [Methylobacterium gnaphalii]GJD67514.1 hypothetical protein MMMDOFMJ_0429 [Methylobacterium gnaphalii]GLS49633.1 hypothetical protein GCM10007885_24830 [Methylobacterium gnaphalii]